MEHNPFAPQFDDLPQSLAVFPLSSAFLLPSGHLPLNIFEPRYLQMVEDALAGNRLIGMIDLEAGQRVKVRLKVVDKGREAVDIEIIR